MQRYVPQKIAKAREFYSGGRVSSFELNFLMLCVDKNEVCTRTNIIGVFYQLGEPTFKIFDWGFGSVNYPEIPIPTYNLPLIPHRSKAVEILRGMGIIVYERGHKKNA